MARSTGSNSLMSSTAISISTMLAAAGRSQVYSNPQPVKPSNPQPQSNEPYNNSSYSDTELYISPASTGEDQPNSEEERKKTSGGMSGVASNTCSQRLTGHCVNYVRDSPLYQDLDMADRVNFAIFMQKYNVEKNKEFAGGLEEVKGKSWEQMSFEFIRNPQRLINFMTFVSFFVVVLLFVIWLIMVFLSSFTEINPAKKSTTLWMVISLIGLILLTYILDFVYNRTLDNLENLSYTIK